MTTKKTNLETSLLGRKCTAKYAHMWFNPSQEFMAPLPTDQATIVAVFANREKDGSAGVMIVIENEKGLTLTYYVDSVVLVPLQKPALKIIERLEKVLLDASSGVGRTAVCDGIYDLIQELKS